MKKKLKKDKEIGEFKMIDIRAIVEPQHAMRTDFDREKLQELSDSIKKVGLIQPITVFEKGKNFEVLVGHRRFKACKMLGLGEVKAFVIASGEAINETMKMHENIVREDVNVVDEANFLKDLMKRRKMNAKEMAKEINKSEGYVSQRIGVVLYDANVQAALYEGKISFSVAREFARIDDKKVLKEYLGYAVTNGCTPATAKQWADTYIALTAKEMSGKKSGKVELGEVRGGKVMVQCNITKEMFPIEETTMYRINNKTAREMGLIG